MESTLCCPLYKALTLDPVPVIGSMIYVPGAEGFDLRDLTEEIVNPCPAHKFTFKHTVDTLLRYAVQTGPCSCSSSSSSSSSSSPNSSSLSTSPHNEMATECSSPPFGTEKARIVSKGGGEKDGLGSKVKPQRILWAYEMDSVVTAYRWLIQHRCLMYATCCKAVIVCQLKSSKCLPPGLYIYRNRLSHFGCTEERPLKVVDQFNFGGCDDSFGSEDELPSIIMIPMYPGCDNYSCLYIISRNIHITVPEYSNRIVGEAMALEIMEPCSLINAAACEHQEVAMRTERACVIDLRWKGFDTRTSCVRAIPKVRGLQAVVWSNHSGNVQETECKVLTWLFGLSNELPKEVQLIDCKREALGVRYILMDMDTFPGPLPQPPSENVSFFIQTYFMGDVTLATKAIGEVPRTRSRMASPCPNVSAFVYWYSLPPMGHCQPTPFTCGVRRGRASMVTDTLKNSLLQWSLEKDGSSCLAIAVQHTLYYNMSEMKYKMMVTHTVMDNDTSLNIFKL